MHLKVYKWKNKGMDITELLIKVMQVRLMTSSAS